MLALAFFTSSRVSNTQAHLPEFKTQVNSDVQYPKSGVHIGTIFGCDGKLGVTRSSRPLHLHRSFQPSGYLVVDCSNKFPLILNPTQSNEQYQNNALCICMLSFAFRILNTLHMHLIIRAQLHMCTLQQQRIKQKQTF